MGGLNAETAGNLLSGGQDIYNMVEDNKAVTARPRRSSTARLTTPIRIWPKMIIIITMTPSKIVGTSVIKSVKTPSTEPLTAQKAC